MRILFAAAEMAPLVRVGGLGEVAGGLTKALRSAGAEVQMVLPDYSQTPLLDERVEVIDVPEWVGEASARTGMLNGFGEVTLVDVPDIRRPGAYGDPDGDGYVDNDRRFFAFSAAVAAIARQSEPDVIHVNDWHTGAVLAWAPAHIPTVASIHNLAYQGHADRGWLLVFGDRSSAYDREGNCNPLAGSLLLADRVVAVSPNYATEILHEPIACGMGDILNARSADGALVGIINGIDGEEWNPETDASLAVPFSAKKLAGKQACKAALRTTMDLPETSGPLFGFVTRLVEQKGVEYVVEMAEFLESVDGQLVILGSGERGLSDAVHHLVETNRNRVAFYQGYDLDLSHQIFAGSDCYVMPSRFEPCGLAQMQAMAYGTLPVVTDVGGLHDTVIDLTRHPTVGTGFVSRTVSGAGMVDAMHRAAALFPDRKKWAAAQQRGMTTDWTWAGPTEEYLELYGEAIRAKRNLSLS
jgi:starch synthase